MIRYIICDNNVGAIIANPTSPPTIRTFETREEADTYCIVNSIDMENFEVLEITAIPTG